MSASRLLFNNTTTSTLSTISNSTPMMQAAIHKLLIQMDITLGINNRLQVHILMLITLHLKEITVEVIVALAITLIKVWQEFLPSVNVVKRRLHLEN